jgi:hypothetical protein
MEKFLRSGVMENGAFKPTTVTTYGQGYSLLGFWLSSRSRRMRPKSLLKFKDKIREVTGRKHNFEAKVIVELNQVIRGPIAQFDKVRDEARVYLEVCDKSCSYFRVASSLRARLIQKRSWRRSKSGAWTSSATTSWSLALASCGCCAAR